MRVRGEGEDDDDDDSEDEGKGEGEVARCMSLTVTVRWPSGPQQKPFIAKFFRNSQPRAPQPTMKYLVVVKRLVLV